MINLVDKEVYVYEISAVSRTQVIVHFCQTGHSDDILFITEDGSYQGYIGYKNVLGYMAGDVEDWLTTDHITAGSDVIDQAKEYFEVHPNRKTVLVLNEEGEPEVFAENKPAGRAEPTYDMALATIERYPEKLSVFLDNRMKWEKCVGITESEEEVPEWGFCISIRMFLW